MPAENFCPLTGGGPASKKALRQETYVTASFMLFRPVQALQNPWQPDLIGQLTDFMTRCR